MQRVKTEKAKMKAKVLDGTIVMAIPRTLIDKVYREFSALEKQVKTGYFQCPPLKTNLDTLKELEERDLARLHKNVKELIDKFQIENPDVEKDIERILPKTDDKKAILEFQVEEEILTRPEEPEDFEFVRRPYDHQLGCWYWCKERKENALILEMGTGKTQIGIDVARWRFQQNQIDNVLVFCPNTIIDNWVNEIKTCSNFEDDEIIILKHYDRAKRAQKLYINNGGKFYIINYDGIRTISNHLNTFVNDHETMLIADESTKIKNPSAQRTKDALEITDNCNYKMIMTGTPVTNSPLEIWPQYRFLSKEIFPETYNAFLSRYSKKSSKYSREYKHLEELHERIRPFSLNIKKDDCLELPDKIYEPRKLSLKDPIKTAYKRMENRAELQLTEEGDVNAVNVASMIMRLCQISSGYAPILKDEDDEPEKREHFEAIMKKNFEEKQLEPDFDEDEIVTDIHEDYVYFKNNQKLKELFEIVEEYEESQIVIWCRFKANLYQLKHEFKKRGIDYSLLFGEIDQDQRQTEINKFQKGKTRIMIANPQVGGMGINLTNADIIVYYSLSYSLEERRQSEDRTHRIGQSNNPVYIDLMYSSTVDIGIVSKLMKKEQFIKQVVDRQRSDSSDFLKNFSKEQGDLFNLSR